MLSNLGYDDATFTQLKDDVIVLGQAKQGTHVAIDPDGLAGSEKPKIFVLS